MCKSVCNRLGDIRDLLVEETERLSPLRGTPDTDTSPGSESEPKRARLFGSCFSEQLRTPGDAKGEVEKLFSSPRQNPDADVIQFWNENSKSYPQSGQSSSHRLQHSASAERVFSAAGLVSRNHRTSLKPQTLSRFLEGELKRTVDKESIPKPNFFFHIF